MNKKKLFELSYAKRKENFVKGRFGQEEVFGREDIEVWLIGQSESTTPEWRGLYHRDLSDLMPEGMNLWQLVRSGASPVDAGVPMLPVRHQADQRLKQLWREVFSHAGTDRAVAFHGPLGDLVIVAQPEGQRNLIYVGPDQELHIDYLRGSDLAQMLWAEWFYHQPLWEKSRNLLCEAVAKLIAKERDKAEADFDKAVACSSDGRKIVSAKHVVVISDGKFIAYAPDVFLRDKVLRPGSLLRDSGQGSCWGFPTVTNYLGSSTTTQILDPINGAFYTQAALCPQPLPAGGREVKWHSEL